MPNNEILDPMWRPSNRNRLENAESNVKQPQAGSSQPFPAVGMSLPSYLAESTEETTMNVNARTPVSYRTSTVKPRRWPSFKFKKKYIVIPLVIGIALCVGWVGGKLVYNAIKVFHGSVFSVLSPSKLNGEDSGRVNILLTGYSVDDPQNTGGTLTDSIMVISVDVQHNTAYLLSVPRDLYVDIPGYGYAKINEAYEDGQSGGYANPSYPRGGMGLLEQVITTNFNIPINYYVLLDNNAVKQAVDAVGGITITINSPDPRGIYDAYTHLKLPNGQVNLTGQQALNLARARGDTAAGDVSYGLPGSDFDRTEHQREMLLALKQKAMSTGVLANPVKLGSLFDAFGNNVKTDLTLGDVRRLYDFSTKISNAAVQSYGLNNVTFDGRQNVDLLANYWTASGEETLVPAAGINDYSQIQQLIKQISSNDPVVKEAAKVVVLNATNTSGLAASVSKTLAAKGINVVAVGNAPIQATSSVIDASSGKVPATAALLHRLYSAQESTTNPYSGIYTTDLILILGTNTSASSGATP